MLLISLLFLHLSLSQGNAVNFTLEMVWKQNLDGKVLSSPVLSETKVFVGSNSKKMFCLDRNSGKIQWNFTAQKSVKVPGVLSNDNNDFFFGDDNLMHALHAENGSTLWSSDVAGPVNDAPVWGSEDTLIFGSSAIYCLNSSTGEELWSFDTGLEVEYSPAVGKKRVFVGSQNHFFYCLKTKNGNKKWEFDTGGELTTSPVLDDGNGNVIVGSATGLYALKQSNGNEIWSHSNTNSSLKSKLAINNDTLYHASADGIIEALRTSDGTPVWSFDSGNKVDSGLALDANGIVFFGGMNNSLCALDGEDGTLLWTYSVGDKVKTIPAFGSNNTVFFGSKDKNVYAIRYSEDSGGGGGGGDHTPGSTDGDQHGDSTLNAGSITGIAIGCLVATALLIGLCFWFRCRSYCKKNKK